MGVSYEDSAGGVFIRRILTLMHAPRGCITSHILYALDTRGVHAPMHNSWVPMLGSTIKTLTISLLTCSTFQEAKISPPRPSLPLLTAERGNRAPYQLYQSSPSVVERWAYGKATKSVYATHIHSCPAPRPLDVPVHKWMALYPLQCGGR